MQHRIDAWLERLYRRASGRLFLVLACVAMANGLLVTVVVVVASVPNVNASFGQVVACITASAVLLLISMTISYRHCRPWFDSLVEWQTGARSAELAQEAWTSTVRATEQAIFYGTAVFSLVFVPYTPFLLWELHMPWYYAFALPFVVELTIVFAAALDYFAFSRMLRPVIREISHQVPADFEPDHQTVSLGVRLVMVSTMVGVFVAYITSATDGVASPLARTVVGLGVAAGVMLVIGVPPGFFLADSVTTPLNELVNATRRVEAGDLTRPVPLVSADETGRLTRSFNRMMRGLAEREALQQAMGSYVDPGVAARVLSEGELLSGDEMIVTIMFVDIRGFTTASEHRNPQETVQALNDFFGAVVPVVVEHGGVVNKFTGDGLLAVFGAPTAHDDHADRALAAASGIVEVVDGQHRVGIGINSGPVIVGSIGGGGRLEFGLIGDVVNVASRIEQLAKERNETILLSETTHAALRHPPDGLDFCGPATLRGRAEPLGLYSLR